MSWLELVQEKDDEIATLRAALAASQEALQVCVDSENALRARLAEVERERMRGDENERLRGLAADHAADMEREVDTLRADLANLATVVERLTREREDYREKRANQVESLRDELATILAERDAAVSMGTQLERERDEWRAKYARCDLTRISAGERTRFQLRRADRLEAALRMVSRWREACHSHDADTGHPPRYLGDEEEWGRVEEYARAALSAPAPAHEGEGAT